MEPRAEGQGISWSGFQAALCCWLGPYHPGSAGDISHHQHLPHAAVTSRGGQLVWGLVQRLLLGSEALGRSLVVKSNWGRLGSGSHSGSEVEAPGAESGSIALLISVRGLA